MKPQLRLGAFVLAAGLGTGTARQAGTIWDGDERSNTGTKPNNLGWQRPARIRSGVTLEFATASTTATVDAKLPDPERSSSTAVPASRSTGSARSR